MLRRPPREEEIILLTHGDGGAMTRELIGRLFLKHWQNPYLNKLADAAVLEPVAGRLAMTTDSFVVDPLFFAGGDIGKLAVCGTVNDLAVSGAVPLYLTVSFIIEEGLSVELLERVAVSMAGAGKAAGVIIVAGDTKVVGRGAADRLFISTAGIGRIPDGLDLGCHRISPGDMVLVSGNLGDHGLTILAGRNRLGLEGQVESDCAPLNGLALALGRSIKSLRVMRDLTRGGLATAAKEIAQAAGMDIWLEEMKIPVSPVVRGATGLLGLDPLYLANEGKIMAVVGPGDAGEALAIMRSDPLGRDAAIIGEVRAGEGELYLRTPLGGVRPLDLLAGEPLPRIC